MTSDALDPLALEEQVCFALAVASRSVVAAYGTVLRPLGLTHPQYLVMLALWQHGPTSVTELARLLHLEPGTVSPLVRRLEQSGLVERARSASDQRALEVTLTPQGLDLRQEALAVPEQMLARLGMSVDELRSVNALLHGVIAAAEDAPNR
ncbi:MarR family winged helix-turn-helix transcriptional regulator [Aeromicrobium sp. Leaf350]|uniref:MarR family winged helix-turn-helix transcriptional regulator n=1 Tax=Aeromicrobium sp. Leaf350 TaxID=2876565 RepID=UPI001E45F030|nr:MarR family transcriptional regulator [Aeromicrobium sp. Leaf350]